MRKIFFALMLASAAGFLTSCEDDTLVTNANAVTVSAGLCDGYTTPNTARVKVWYKKENYSSIKESGIICGTNKDADFLETYGKDIHNAFDGVDTVYFNITDLDANTEYYYMAYAEDAEGVRSYSGIRIFKTLKDDISCTPGFLEFGPVNITKPSADTLQQYVSVHTLYENWEPAYEADVYPWIKAVDKLNDTLMRVTVSVVKDQASALNGRTAPIRISATSGTTVKTRSFLINQGAVTTAMTNEDDYVYSYLATGGNAIVGNVNVPIEGFTAPSWVNVSRASTGDIQVTVETNKSIETREGEVTIVTSLTLEENTIKVSQAPGIVFGSDVWVLPYQAGYSETMSVVTYDGEAQISTATTNNASADFKALFTITRPRTGGITLRTLTENSTLDTIRQSIDVYYGSGTADSPELHKTLTVLQAPTDFSIDKEVLQFPKSVHTYRVTASHALDGAETDADWLQLSTEGAVVAISTTGETSSERSADVFLKWGEHIATVHVTQLTVNDEPASDLTIKETLDLPYGETASVSLDMNTILKTLGLSETAFDAYYIPSSSSNMGKTSTTEKSIIWRALKRNGDPYVSARGANLYTGTGYGSWFDAEGDATTAANGVISYSYNESTNAIDVEMSDKAEEGKSYTGTLEMIYVQPSGSAADTNYIKITVTTNVKTALLKELYYEADKDDYKVSEIDSKLAYAFGVEESEVAGMISNGEISFLGISSDGSSTSTKTYSNTGFIFDKKGDVAGYPNPTYVAYEKSELILGHVSGVAALTPGEYEFTVKFVYNGIELPVTFYVGI